ncbi:MAG: SDR family NAD(P)-dependent oxidoreductase [Flavobacterium sp.]|nr:MAG: SDR family NAD(P)-dependent oxidoreductase [Flavobacterium sp.]
MEQQSEIKTISILGCGWYGLPMAKSLINQGFNLKGSTTTEAKLSSLSNSGIKAYLIDTEKESFDEEFFDCDLLIISIPPKVNSEQLPYPIKIKNIAAAAEKAGLKQIILISSTGIYQDGNFIVDETVKPAPNTPSGIALKEAEDILLSNNAFTTTIIRFAGLIGPNRNLAKHFAGKIEIANGNAPINLIHLDDCLGLTQAIINQKDFGKVYHGVTPDHPTRKAFYSQSCIASGFEAANFKDELLSWKQVDSKNVPEMLAYEFKVKNWLDYLNS